MEGLPNPRSLPYQMVYDRVGFYLPHYCLSTWKYFVARKNKNSVSCFVDTVCVNHEIYVDAFV